ncbi:trans-aconitate 2-methyltransferase [Halobacteriovorax sp. HLS]|uniref:class I SAM-dependent methyltransferase n=1 Tax=Halobacteriovorax sp. HLS TaxID=2234000 RepID=UPI000FD7A6C0|nr:class I SAM-dependent methyltransferase [Halobacteriovorax sp. HLS]
MNKYDTAFSNLKSKGYTFTPSDSLIEFCEFYKKSFNTHERPSILELGCGPYLHFYNEGSIGVELSSAAIEMAELSHSERITCSSIFDYQGSGKFDILFDSHLLHCLSSVSEVQKYFEVVSGLLNCGGHFLLECMVKPQRLVVDEGYLFDEDQFTLSHNGLVHRVILPTFELEKIVQACGLKIVYFRVDEKIKFIPYSHRSESLPTDPDRLRMICLKE